MGNTNFVKVVILEISRCKKFLELFNAKRPMILAGGGIHARPDSTAFNLELQRLAETIRSNVKLESDEGIVCRNFLVLA